MFGTAVRSIVEARFFKAINASFSLSSQTVDERFFKATNGTKHAIKMIQHLVQSKWLT